MGFLDTIKGGAKELYSTVKPLGTQLLENEIARGRNEKPETRPDTKTNPISTTQKFDPPKRTIVDKKMMIGIAGVGAVVLIAGILISKR